jgi:hypothetical protein
VGEPDGTEVALTLDTEHGVETHKRGGFPHDVLRGIAGLSEAARIQKEQRSKWLANIKQVPSKRP